MLLIVNGLFGSPVDHSNLIAHARWFSDSISCNWVGVGNWESAFYQSRYNRFLSHCIAWEFNGNGKKWGQWIFRWSKILVHIQAESQMRKRFSKMAGNFFKFKRLNRITVTLSIHSSPCLLIVITFPTECKSRDKKCNYVCFRLSKI